MSGVTILMVDDETEILKLMEIYVRNEGYTSPPHLTAWKRWRF